MISLYKKYQSHIIATLAFTLISNLLNEWFQALTAFFLIFTLGLIHGANDLKLIQTYTQKKSTFYFFKILGIYIGVVLLGIFVFYFLPKFGLLFFVLFSAFHFGEQHLENQWVSFSHPFFKEMAYLAYGAIVFGMLFYFQWVDVHQVIYTIAGVFIGKQLMLLLMVGGFLLFSAAYLWIKKSMLRFWIEISVLLLLALLFSTTPLIYGFAIYFVVWHSVPSIQDQIRFLYPKQKTSFLSYLKSSMPYWIASVVGLGFVYFYFDISSFSFLPLFFSFLAAITFPHTVVMGVLKLGENNPEGTP